MVVLFWVALMECSTSSWLRRAKAVHCPIRIHGKPPTTARTTDKLFLDARAYFSFLLFVRKSRLDDVIMIPEYFGSPTRNPSEPAPSESIVLIGVLGFRVFLF